MDEPPNETSPRRVRFEDAMHRAVAEMRQMIVVQTRIYVVCTWAAVITVWVVAVAAARFG